MKCVLSGNIDNIFTCQGFEKKRGKFKPGKIYFDIEQKVNCFSGLGQPTRQKILPKPSKEIKVGPRNMSVKGEIGQTSLQSIFGDKLWSFLPNLK